MKAKLLLLLFALSIGAYAQGDLQFNQVLTFTVEFDESNVYTVPDGKVAKIATATLNRTGNTSTLVLINGIIPGGSSGVTYEVGNNMLNGTWLKAGDIIGAEVYYNYKPLFLSIIEYNIISP